MPTIGHSTGGTSTSSSTTIILAIVLTISTIMAVIIIVTKLRRAGALGSSPVWPRWVAQAPPGSQRRPVIAEFLANSRTSAVAPDERSPNVEPPPRTVITHQDDHRVPQVGPARPTDLPPPYSPIPLV